MLMTKSFLAMGATEVTVVVVLVATVLFRMKFVSMKATVIPLLLHGLLATPMGVLAVREEREVLVLASSTTTPLRSLLHKKGE